MYWSILAGFGAILAILHTNLKIPDRLRNFASVEQHLKGLCINLETFRYKIMVDPNFAIKEFNDEFLGYREQYLEDFLRLKHDLLITKRRRTKVQEELNGELRDLISTI